MTKASPGESTQPWKQHTQNVKLDPPVRHSGNGAAESPSKATKRINDLVMAE